MAAKVTGHFLKNSYPVLKKASKGNLMHHLKVKQVILLN